jgi:GTP cyclohydrolase IA
MKLRETMSNTKGNNAIVKGISDLENIAEQIDWLGQEHIGSSVETPLRKDAFRLSSEEKVDQIELKFAEILNILGLDLTDDSLKGTPRRVAKMYVNEVFSGLKPEEKPEAKLFKNTFNYNEMLVEKGIKVHSYCEHHLVPIIGVAHVAYISSGFVIGLSKINRIVRYFSKRPQVQERLTQQIAKELQEVLMTEDVAIVLDAEHFCVKTRGIEDDASSTLTSFFGGKFKETEVKNEFLKHIYNK